VLLPLKRVEFDQTKVARPVLVIDPTFHAVIIEAAGGALFKNN
jgi:hypothetical protein